MLRRICCAIQTLKIARAQLARDVLGLSQRERNDRERGIGGSRCAQGTAVRYEQVGHIVGPSIGINNPVTGVFAHARRAHVVRGRRLP